MTDASAEIDVEIEALTKGSIEDTELLEKKAVAEVEGEGEGSAGGDVAGGDVAGGDESGGSSSVPGLSDVLIKTSFAVLAREWTGPCD